MAPIMHKKRRIERLVRCFVDAFWIAAITPFLALGFVIVSRAIAHLIYHAIPDGRVKAFLFRVR